MGLSAAMLFIRPANPRGVTKQFYLLHHGTFQASGVRIIAIVLHWQNNRLSKV